MQRIVPRRIQVTTIFVLLLLWPMQLRAELIGCSVAATTPVAIDDYGTWPGGAVVVDVIANDFDYDGDFFSITGFTQGANGSVAFTEDNEALLYTPFNPEAVSDSFTYTISDGQFSATGTVHLTADPQEPPEEPPPTAAVSLTYACTDLECHFTANWQNIDDAPRYFHWEWGGGQTTPPNYSSRMALHDYAPGTHQARVTITFVSGRVLASDWTPVVVATPTITCRLEIDNWGMLFTGHVRDLSNNGALGYDYWIDLDDPASPPFRRDAFSAQQPFGTTYRTPRPRTIRYWITANNDSTVLGQCVDSRDFTNHDPEPDFEATPGDGITRAKKLFRFTPTSFDEWFNELTPWEWNFGDGSFTQTSGASAVDHYYPRPGDYTVTLKVTDSLGGSGTISKTITAPNDPPIVNWKFNCKGRDCKFDASETMDDSGVVTYTWDFGDGSSSAALGTPTATHTFAADQAYDVTLTVSDGTETVAKKKKVTPRLAPLAQALVFYTLPPCRVADSRLDGRPPINSGVIDEVAVAGRCGVPATAKAVAGNLTIISPANVGHVRVFPSGTTAPDASTLNFTPARSPRSNDGIFALGVNGGVSIIPTLFPSGTTHYALDVTGYFSDELTPAPLAKGPMRYDRYGSYWRVYDSRTTPPALGTGGARLIKARNSAYAFLPLDAEAMALNITTYNATSGGHLTLYPSDIAETPLASALNFQQGIAQGNGSIVGLGRRTNDDLALVLGASAGNTADFTIDTEGWFAKNALYRYYPIQPCRAADTRKLEHGGPRLTAGAERNFQIQGNCGVPAGAKFAVVNAAVVTPDAAGTGRIGWIYDPALTNVQFAAADTIASTHIVGLSPLSESNCCASDMSASTSAGADLVIDVLGYFLPEENQPPLANPDARTAVINLPITIDVLANDSDANGDTIKLSPDRAVFNPPTLGTATRASDTSITYTSTLSGSDSFEYEVIDTRGGKSHGVVTIEVRATNEGPVANPDTATTALNSSVTIDALANDSDPENDALTLSAVTTPAQGSAEIRSNRILYTPGEEASGTDTFNYTVRDEFGATATASVTITLLVPNRPPVLLEDAAAVLIGATATITPLANDTDPDSDTLVLSDPAITVAPTLGTVTRTSDTTLTYTAGQSSGADTFQYSATDGHGNTGRASVSVIVHHAPVAANDTAVVAPGQSVTVNVVGNDSDPDGDAIALATNPIVTAPTLGTAARASATSITYTAGTTLGTDLLTYEIVDAHGAPARAQLSIVINGGPVAVDDAASVNVNQPVTVNVVANDSDPDGDVLTLAPAAVVVAPAYGTATRASNTEITYTATSGASGTDVLTYEIVDGRGGTARAKLNVRINRAPTAVADSAIVAAGGSVIINVLGNDTDPDAGTTLQLDTPAIVTAPATGAAEIHTDGRQLVYRPGASTTTDSFTYAVIDGSGGRAVGTVSITVNRPPVAVGDNITLTNDGPVDLNVTANDSDPDGDVVKMTASPFKTLPVNGTAIRVNDSTIRYTPNAGSFGTDTFNIEVTDGRNGFATGNANMIVHRRPVAVADSATVNQDQSVTVNVVANDTDADGDSLLLPAAPITAGPAIGTATRASNTTITYSATNSGANTSTFFDYKVSDNRNALSANAARVAITINRKPVAANDSAVAINNGQPITINVTANDTDPEGDVVKLTVSPIVTPPSLGTAVRASDTSFTYTPNGVGTTTFVYQVVDARGAGPVNATVTVRIDPPNRPPVASADTGTASAQNVALDVNVTANDTDPDGDPITVVSVGTNANGTPSVLNASTVRFTPTAGYAGKTTFTYTIQDSKGAQASGTVTAQIPGEIVRAYAGNSDVPITGDWNGDGKDDLGAYRPSTRTWYLEGIAPFVWGVSQWDLPVAGDWDGDGKDEVGLYRDPFAQWFLRTSPTTAFPGTQVTFGTPNWKPIVGDWNGDNRDELGVFDPNSATFSLQGQAAFVFGLGTDLPIAGDWNKDNKDEVGVYRPDAPAYSQATFFLRHSATYTQSIVYGAHDDRPLAGDWGGVGRDSVGFAQYLSTTWRMNVGATGW